MQGTSLSDDLKLHLDRFSLLPLYPFPSGDPLATAADEADDNNKDCCILSQDFFCTPDYITPKAPPISNEFGLDKENTCPRSPDKLVTDRKKRCRLEDSGFDNRSIDLPCDEQTIALRLDAFGMNEMSPKDGSQKKDTDGFVIPSLGVEESDFINSDVQEVKDFKPPAKPTKEEQKIYLGPHGAPPSQSKQQELNTTNRKQRLKHKLQEADRKYSGTGRENKVENLRELVGGKVSSATNMPKSSGRDWLDPHCHESQFERYSR